MTAFLSSPLIRLLSLLLFTVLPLLHGEQSTSQRNLIHEELERKSSQGVLLQTVTTERGITCPVYRDEEGFLAEFVAYYQLHGLAHIRFYDDGSNDQSRDELQPWISSGFVSVVSNTSGLLLENLKKGGVNEKNSMKWQKMLRKTGERNTIQRVAEADCKVFATMHKFDFLFSLDIDEYLVPDRDDVTVMDTISHLSNRTQKSIFSIQRLNFGSIPHLLEPVNMLTIEAFKVRMSLPMKLTYFKTVAPKLIIHLSRPDITKFQRQFIMQCCNFHNCIDVNCRHFLPSDTDYLYNGNGSDVENSVIIFHYSRSLEKFMQKRRTWQKIGENNFTLTNFMDRNIGSIYDDRADVRYSWQVREVLARATSQKSFVRPGRGWRLKQPGS